MNKRDLNNQRLIAFEEERDFDPENYSVEVYSYNDTTLGLNALWEVWRNSEGELDRRFGPAMVSVWAEDGSVILEEYYHKGVLHREDGPAVFYRDPRNDQVLQEEYYRDGVRYYPNTKSALDPAP
ncbi:MAG: hypothetical protein AAGL10_06340 [Pseudomonadota bacterium]